jgi:hypothetical protein
MSPYYTNANGLTVRADGGRTTRSPSRFRAPGRRTPRGAWPDAAEARRSAEGHAPVRPEDRGRSRKFDHCVPVSGVQRPRRDGPRSLRAAANHEGASRSSPITQDLQPNVRPVTMRRDSAAEARSATDLIASRPAFSSLPGWNGARILLGPDALRSVARPPAPLNLTRYASPRERPPRTPLAPRPWPSTSAPCATWRAASPTSTPAPRRVRPSTACPTRSTDPSASTVSRP